MILNLTIANVYNSSSRGLLSIRKENKNGRFVLVFLMMTNSRLLSALASISKQICASARSSLLLELLLVASTEVLLLLFSRNNFYLLYLPPLFLWSLCGTMSNRTHLEVLGCSWLWLWLLLWLLSLCLSLSVPPTPLSMSI